MSCAQVDGFRASSAAEYSANCWPEAPSEPAAQPRHASLPITWPASAPHTKGCLSHARQGPAYVREACA